MKTLAAVVLLLSTTLAQAQNLSSSGTFLKGPANFMQIADVNRQADAWGTCSAVYSVMSMMSQDTPNTAKRLSELANGARVAVTMAHVADGLQRDLDPSQFSAVWDQAKMLGQTISGSQQTMILSQLELIGPADAEGFGERLNNTLTVCGSNLEAQQAYVDMWRSLMKSGLLRSPSGD